MDAFKKTEKTLADTTGALQASVTNINNQSNAIAGSLEAETPKLKAVIDALSLQIRDLATHTTTIGNETNSLKKATESVSIRLDAFSKLSTRDQTNSGKFRELAKDLSVLAQEIRGLVGGDKQVTKQDVEKLINLSDSIGNFAARLESEMPEPQEDIKNAGPRRLNQQ
jgi:uncharacterized protein (DUF3084 family)